MPGPSGGWGAAPNGGGCQSRQAGRHQSSGPETLGINCTELAGYRGRYGTRDMIQGNVSGTTTGYRGTCGAPRQDTGECTGNHHRIQGNVSSATKETEFRMEHHDKIQRYVWSTTIGYKATGERMEHHDRVQRRYELTRRKSTQGAIFYHI